jgi:hypothetical protein
MRSNLRQEARRILGRKVQPGKTNETPSENYGTS